MANQPHILATHGPVAAQSLADLIVNLAHESAIVHAALVHKNQVSIPQASLSTLKALGLLVQRRPTESHRNAKSAVCRCSPIL